jgi:hypothetical protein
MICLTAFTSTKVEPAICEETPVMIAFKAEPIYMIGLILGQRTIMTKRNKKRGVITGRKLSPKRRF